MSARAPSLMRAKGQGIGPVHSFLCIGCGRTKPTLGRKMQRVAGMRAYVCAACARSGRPA